MRPLRNSLLLVTLILITQGIALAQSSDEQRLAITRDVTTDFAHGELASVRQRFSDDLKDSVTEDDLKSAREKLIEAAGAFQSQISQSTRTVQGEPIYVSKSQFEQFKVEMKLTFDDANHITDSRIAPVSDLSQESMETAAKTIADLLRQEHFEELDSKFNQRMKETMPTAVCKARGPTS